MDLRLRQRRTATLEALADTFVPRLGARADDHGLFAHSASGLGVPEALLDLITTRVAERARTGLLQLVDALGRLKLGAMPVALRERAVLPALARLSPEAALGLEALRSATLLLTYSLTDASGRNPLWKAIGYPGPPEVRAPEVRPLPVLTLEGPVATLAADVVVIGSGAGGSVIAAELARAGRAVVVLEAGRQFGEQDFPRDEAAAFRSLYWRGGYQQSADGMFSIVAGGTLGGGTTINWSNCYPTPPQVRAEWAREHGLDDLEGSAFDAHLAAVSARLGVTDALSDDHGSNARLRAGATALGHAARRVQRNATPASYDPHSAGHIGHGDRSGSKQSTLRTYLADAAAAGARIVVGCRVDLILTERGQARGVRAICTDGSGARVTLEVHAPQVVVACGALETPALLLRSGLGGPAVGHHLRLHPAFAMIGQYEERVDPWVGAPQATQVTQFLDHREGRGFLVECVHFHPGLWGALIPWTSGRAHKERMQQIARTACFIGRLRERGSGRVTLDELGEAQVHYPLSDALDRRHVGEALGVLGRLHEAAGAQALFDLGRGKLRWARGESLERFLDAARAVGFAPGERPYFSAHQMGTARMGRDPATSVADPRGELHTTRGIWIGDTSAFPTATGANPMLTAMALARRTAQAIAGATVGRGLAEMEVFSPPC